MAVSIDTVYQKVLALANKEQRGYITPQEFNLMADRAQMEIYDSYFHDVKTAYNKISNNSKYSDELEMLDEKLSPFLNINTDTINADASIPTVSLPSTLYYLKAVSISKVSSSDVSAEGYSSGETFFHEIDRRDFLNISGHPLLAPTGTRPVFVRIPANTIEISPTPTINVTIKFYFYKTPATPSWGYVVVNGRALHNNSATYTTDFELHPSEEENLVNKILQYSGIIMQKTGLIEAAMTEIAQKKQSQND